MDERLYGDEENGRKLLRHYTVSGPSLYYCEYIIIRPASRRRTEGRGVRVKKLLHTHSAAPRPTPDRVRRKQHDIIYQRARQTCKHMRYYYYYFGSVDSDFKFTIEGVGYGAACRRADGRAIRTTVLLYNYAVATAAAMTLNKALWFLFFSSLPFFSVPRHSICIMYNIITYESIWYFYWSNMCVYR